jgi:hypothetical protein
MKRKTETKKKNKRKTETEKIPMRGSTVGVYSYLLSS